MFELLFDNTSLPVLQQVMGFSEERQRVLAENLANINTPGYRTNDLPVDEFVEALGEAIDRRDNETPRRFAMQSTRHIDFSRRMRAQRIETNGLQNYYDQSNSSVERIMSEMGKNALWHNIAAELFRHQSQLLETAIRERVG